MSPEIDALKQSLLGSDPAQQAAAAEKLAQLGEDAQPAAVELVRVCAGEAAREWATAALEGLGAPAAADVARGFHGPLFGGHVGIGRSAQQVSARTGPRARGACAR